MDNLRVVNIPVAHTSDFPRAPEPLRTVRRMTGESDSAHRAVEEGDAWFRETKTRPDMRRPPPGGRAGVVPTADSGGEEPDRVMHGRERSVTSMVYPRVF